MATQINVAADILSLPHPAVVFMESTLFLGEHERWSICFVPAEHENAGGFRETVTTIAHRNVMTPRFYQEKLMEKNVLRCDVGFVTAAQAQAIAAEVEEMMGLRRAPVVVGECTRVTGVSITLEVKSVTLNLKGAKDRTVPVASMRPVLFKMTIDDNRLLPQAVWKSDWEATPENVAALRDALSGHLEFRDPGRGDLG